MKGATKYPLLVEAPRNLSPLNSNRMFPHALRCARFTESLRASNARTRALCTQVLQHHPWAGIVYPSMSKLTLTPAQVRFNICVPNAKTSFSSRKLFRKYGLCSQVLTLSRSTCLPAVLVDICTGHGSDDGRGSNVEPCLHPQGQDCASARRVSFAQRASHTST